MIRSLRAKLKQLAIGSLNAYLYFPKLIARVFIGEHKATSRLRTSALRTLVDLPVLFKDRYGLECLIYPKDWTMYDRFYEYGSPEILEQNYCVKTLKPGMTVFDAGANYGTYSLLFCKLAGPENVHAFEPESRSFRRLQQNLALNGFHAAHLNKAAVYSRSSPEMVLNVFPEEKHGWSTLGHAEVREGDAVIKAVAQEKVPAIALDDYCGTQGIKRIDFLKIDVEGAEFDVLKGCGRLMGEGCIESILFEVSGPMVRGLGHDPAEIFKCLRGHRYEIYKFDPAGNLELLKQDPQVYYENFIAKLKR